METSQLTPLETVLSLAPREGAYHTEIPHDWTQGRTTFGGLLAAIAIRGLQQALGSDRVLCSFVMDCIAPAAIGGIAVSVESLRSGKSLTHARATLTQNGVTCAVMLAVLGVPRTSPLRFAGDPPPALSAKPEALVPMPFVPGASPVFTQHFDYRFNPTQLPFSGTEVGAIGGYVRARDAEKMDVAVIAALIDAYPPPTITQLRTPSPTSTVTWMVNFAQPTPPFETQPSAAYFRYEARANNSGDGYSSCDARLWDSEGRLIADSRQLVATFA